MKLTYKSGTVKKTEIGADIGSSIESNLYINKLKKISVTREEIETSELNWGPYIKKQILQLSHDRVSPIIEIEPIKGTTVNFKVDTQKEISTMLGLLRNVYDVIEMNHLTHHQMTSDYLLTGELDFPQSLGKRLFGYLQSKDQLFRDTVIRRQNKWRKHNK